MLSSLKQILPDRQERQIKKYQKLIEQINELEPELEKLSDEALREKTAIFKTKLANGTTVNDIRVEAFAVVREAAKRVLGMRHFDVQLIGGLVLNEGNIAEMPTGEGKTLVASLPSYLRALEDKGVHVITVNEYLAKRDKELIGQIHEFLGLTVGLNISQLSPDQKKQAYEADITYGISNEFGFDYLRDKMVYDKNQRVQRPYHFALIDEIDSILIDEAKTPLIIAGKTAVSSDLFYICARVVKSFKQDVDYLYDPETKTANLTDDGITKVERAFGVDNLYDLEHQTLYHYVLQSLRAKVMFKRDVDYIVQDGEVKLVDMFTGRVMEGRSLSDGLHQAIEAKEGLEVTEQNKTQASITLQNYFRMYPNLAGMTGTAKTEEGEFQQLYNMDVIQVPTNKPRIRIDMDDKIYQTIDQKYQAVTQEVIARHEIGQPILIGTTSIEQSEKVASYLGDVGLEYQLLNAKSVEQEVTLISLAGQKGQITIATNMAGRGTDIMLGEGVAELGGLHIIGTERHQSRRIDNQLKGRAGRQGDPGSTQFFVSIEDEMIQRFASEEIEKKQQSLKTDDHGLILNKDIHEFISRTQRICEGSSFSTREYTLNLDNVSNQQRQIVYELRDKILETDNPLAIATPMVTSAITQTLDEHCPKELLPEEWPLEALEQQLKVMLPKPIQININDTQEREDLEEKVNNEVTGYIDQLKTLEDHPKLQDKIRGVLLTVLDYHWLQHIENMTRLKEGIGLRSFGKEDPMRAYEMEGYDIFVATFNKIERDVSIQLTRHAKKLLQRQQEEQEGA